jgi:hypothetical protein
VGILAALIIYRQNVLRDKCHVNIDKIEGLVLANKNITKEIMKESFAHLPKLKRKFRKNIHTKIVEKQMSLIYRVTNN